MPLQLRHAFILKVAKSSRHGQSLENAAVFDKHASILYANTFSEVVRFVVFGEGEAGATFFRAATFTIYGTRVAKVGTDDVVGGD